jgi:hypothetical protein
LGTVKDVQDHDLVLIDPVENEIVLMREAAHVRMLIARDKRISARHVT